MSCASDEASTSYMDQTPVGLGTCLENSKGCNSLREFDSPMILRRCLSIMRWERVNGCRQIPSPQHGVYQAVLESVCKTDAHATEVRHLHAPPSPNIAGSLTGDDPPSLVDPSPGIGG